MNVNGIPVVLLVDDDEANVELTLMAFEGLSCSVACAGDGAEALDYLYKRGKFAGREGGLPAMVMMDNKMPVLNGVEALREIRREPAFARLPVVMFTGSAQPSDIGEAYAAGANSYIEKPAGRKAFADAIAAMLHYWTALNIV